eukprot:766754-Hanusia_phi.AAC.5
MEDVKKQEEEAEGKRASQEEEREVKAQTGRHIRSDNTFVFLLFSSNSSSFPPLLAPLPPAHCFGIDLALFSLPFLPSPPPPPLHSLALLFYPPSHPSSSIPPPSPIAPWSCWWFSQRMDLYSSPGADALDAEARSELEECKVWWSDLSSSSTGDWPLSRSWRCCEG